MAKAVRKSRYRLKELREDREVTLEALSDDVAISVSQLSRFESGKREPRLDEVLRIAERLRVPWQEIVRGGASGLTDVPLISMVSAGRLFQNPSVENLENARIIQAAGLGDGEWIALRVEGTSMDRISPPDSIIFVNRSDQRLAPNACYVIQDDEEGATYKRYRPDPDRFEPVTFSEGHKTLFPKGAVRILGRVRRTILDM